jgi:hypothetical protein
VLVERGDELAKRYKTCFAELADLHDGLTAFARGTARGGLTADVVLAAGPLEVPRFALPSMSNTGEVYVPFLRHVPDDRTITPVAAAWTRFANALANDPHAEINADVAPSDARPGETGHGPMLTRRDKPQDPRSVIEVLFGGR